MDDLKLKNQKSSEDSNEKTTDLAALMSQQ
jgi:hypothetical protein